MTKSTINYPCPFCEVVNDFKILETVRKPKFRQSGLYRCLCSICEHNVTISSKTPSTYTGKSRYSKYFKNVDGED